MSFEDVHRVQLQPSLLTRNMQSKSFDRLLLFAIFYLAHWFFGNLYEEIVLNLNQTKNSYEK